MVPLSELYTFADAMSYDLYWIRSGDARICSMSVTDGQHCAIMLDPTCLQQASQERRTLAHELGHCCTGSFYNQYAARDLRQKHENRADKWAIGRLIPRDELERAVEAGNTELWQLAEHFGVPEEFMKKAVCWYRHGNLASDLYD